MNHRTLAALLAIAFTAAAIVVIPLTHPVLGWLAMLFIPVVFTAIILATIAVSILRSVCRRDRTLTL